jgi:hypothetical protein
MICQKLDGASPRAKNAEVPSREAKMADRFELSSTERRSAFEELYQYMTNALENKIAHRIATNETFNGVNDPSSVSRIERSRIYKDDWCHRSTSSGTLTKDFGQQFELVQRGPGDGNSLKWTASYTRQSNAASRIT